MKKGLFLVLGLLAAIPAGDGIDHRRGLYGVVGIPVVLNSQARGALVGDGGERVVEGRTRREPMGSTFGADGPQVLKPA